MFTKYGLILFTLSAVCSASAAPFDLKTELKTDVTQFELDRKKSTGEVCENLDTPEWEINDETKENALRFSPHVLFDQVNQPAVKETGTSTGCAYETQSTFKNMQLFKTANQKCKKDKDSAVTEYKVDFKANEIIIHYSQKQNKKEKKSTCHFKLAKKGGKS